ncbi:hypothetical protein P7K49_023409 [Saguinus oedipus]|uniref:Vomeronasal type-1 receptor n=1 Tax=Saguinus oedipus TaxID=9490 RepID=A0ABQ9UN55_SAGOE|nr:hypothetical protein P7K49_023409 [Saguinus oedipus]
MYMVIDLFRHQRRSQHLRSTSLSPRSSPEKKATQTILLLVSFFVVTYSVDVIISSSSTLLWVYNPVILNVQILVVNVYATIAPFVQVSSDERIGDTLESIESCLRLKSQALPGDTSARNAGVQGEGMPLERPLCEMSTLHLKLLPPEPSPQVWAKHSCFEFLKLGVLSLLKLPD